jgi:hypothetical protein
LQAARERAALTPQNHTNRPQLASVSVVLQADLYRWRQVALPLITPEWEMRYFVLQGTTIRCGDVQ